MAAHQAVAQEYQNLGAAADGVFAQAVDDTQNVKLTGHAGRVAALKREIADFERARARSADPKSDASLQQRELELVKRDAALIIERGELLEASAAYGGIVKIFERLQQKLKDDVIDFDLGRALKQFGGDVGLATLTVSADALAGGSGVIIAGSDVVDRVIEGQMVEDEKAQHHYLWLDTYRRAAED
ncbi:MAG: hypothetical protein ACRECQ_15435 [Burkholderiaceae bacterium]